MSASPAAVPTATSPTETTKLTTSSAVTVLAFVNPRSGGRVGNQVLRNLQKQAETDPFLTPFDLSSVNPSEALAEHDWGKTTRILVCGGDGTIGWVMSSVPKEHVSNVPVGSLPLGTGNDWARSLGWGAKYSGSLARAAVKRIVEARSMAFDRWDLSIDGTHPRGAGSSEGTIEYPFPSGTLNNYFSIGLDAFIAHKFHTKREKSPGLFRSPTMNKAWYGLLSVPPTLGMHPYSKLWQQVEVLCDGVLVEIPRGVVGLIALNINSYSGGVDLWKRTKDPKSNILDGSGARDPSSVNVDLEVGHGAHQGVDEDREASFVAVNDASHAETSDEGHQVDDALPLTHPFSPKTQKLNDCKIELLGVKSALALGASRSAPFRAGLPRICSGSHITIRPKKSLPKGVRTPPANWHIQIDGEPAFTPRSPIHISHAGQAQVCVPEPMGGCCCC